MTEPPGPTGSEPVEALTSTTSTVGMSEDDLALLVPAPAHPEDVRLGPETYAVHAERLSSTRTGGGITMALTGPAVDLFQAALRLTSSLQVPEALRRLVESACSITGATWGTIGVGGKTTSGAWRHVTLSGQDVSRSREEILRAITTASEVAADSGVVIDNDLGRASAFTGAIEGESTGSVLSAPLRVHGQDYGRLFLCDKPGGFTDDDVAIVLTLAEAAAVAVDNARLYREARDRERWLAASQELTSMLLSGADAEDALSLIARRIREVAHAETSALVLPSIGDTWICEIADGLHADELVGTFFRPGGPALESLNRQTGILVPSLAEAWENGTMQLRELSIFGPALYVPMIHRQQGIGVILLLRQINGPAFTPQDREIAELVAGQATMAFELADAHHAEEMAKLLDERARIGRDLHDLAIQQLFATGMQISAARERLAASQDTGAGADLRSACQALDSSLAAIDDSVKQIRSIVRSLRDRDEEVSLVERLRREASLARTALGFAPSLIVSVDGQDLVHTDRQTEDEVIAAVDEAIDSDLADDIVAVVREGLSNVARHARASSVSVEVRIVGLQAAGVTASSGEPARQGSEGLRDDGYVEVICRDDGTGINPSVTRRSGTKNMAERARRHGGTFTLGPRTSSTQEQCGTCFSWHVPLARPQRP